MPNKDLSERALTVATLLASRSETGRHGDPQLDFATVVSESRLAPADVGAAVAELEAAKLVVVSHALGEGASGFRSVRPTSALFWLLDPKLKGWDVRRDAHEIARIAVDSGRPVVALEALDEVLRWSPRRINPAASYLVARCYAQGSREISSTYFPRYLVIHAGTKAFADGPADAATPVAQAASAPNYDVALSFAGEDRAAAEALFKALVARGVSVFYDDFEKADLWGKDLYGYLTEVYQDRARYCVMFLSQHYATKAWTSHERKAAQARAFSESAEYILPIRLDATKIAGVLPTVGYLEWSKETPESIADMVVKKLGSPRATPAVPESTVPSPFPVLDIRYEKRRITGERHDYRLIVALTNNTDVVVDLSHVDITFPTALVENVAHHEFLIEGRSDERMSVFRVTADHRKLTVYPGDTLPLFELDYFVDHGIFYRGDFRDEFAPLATVVHVKAFVKGQAPLVAEKSMDELQIF